MPTIYTFARSMQAHTTGGQVVTIPDQVATDQKSHDRRTFPVRRADGTKGRATLRGDLYGLHTSGTGDPVVTMR